MLSEMRMGVGILSLRYMGKLDLRPQSGVKTDIQN